MASTAASAASTLSISSPSFTTEDVAVEGDLTALDLATNLLRPGFLSIAIEASDLQVQTESVQYVEAAVTAVGRDEPTTATSNYKSARVAASTQQDETGLFLVPAGALTYNTHWKTADLVVPSETCRQQPRYFEHDRPRICAPLAESLAMTGLGADSIELQGEFQVFFWGWQGRIEAPSQSTDFWSGSSYELPQAGVALGPSELRHVVMAGNGTITLQVAMDNPVELLAQSAHVEASHFASDTASGSTTVQEAKANVNRRDDNLFATITRGTVTEPDGATIIVGPRQDEFPWLTTATVTGLLLAPVGVVVSRSKSASRHVQYARDNVALGNYHSAARHAEAALGSRKLGTQAGILGAIALIRANDLEDANLFVSELRRRRQTEPAAVSYLEACIAAKSGNPARAAQLLKASVSANPAYRREAQANPILERAVQELGPEDAP